MLRVKEFWVIISKSLDPSIAPPVANEIWIYIALKVKTDLRKTRNKAGKYYKLLLTKITFNCFYTLKNIPFKRFFIQYA